MGVAMPIWADGASEPGRVSLIRGKAELLSGMYYQKAGFNREFRGAGVNSRLGRVDGE